MSHQHPVNHKRSAIFSVLLAALAACNSGSENGVSSGRGADALAGNTNCTTATEVTFPIPETPFFTVDAMGPLSDVTCDWQRYQAATKFCVQLTAPELTPGGPGPLTGDGNDPACKFSGFSPSDTDLYVVKIDAPELCDGCRRFFVDFSKIPADQPDQFIYYAHGHVFYALASLNPSYTINPIAHSPNTKNFYNDWLVSPPDTPISTVVNMLDSYDKSYVTDTRTFAHTGAQGPYYIGPWYVNRDGERINGIYLDVNVGGAQDLGDPNFNAIRYFSGHNSGQPSCPDNVVPGYSDFNLLYFGCTERPGGSSVGLNPFP